MKLYLVTRMPSYSECERALSLPQILGLFKEEKTAKTIAASLIKAGILPIDVTEIESDII